MVAQEGLNDRIWLFADVMEGASIRPLLHVVQVHVRHRAQGAVPVGPITQEALANYWLRE